jgi:hypothetical protein
MKIYILKFVNAIQLNKFNLSTFFFSVPGEDYSRNVSCTLNLISTFLLHGDLYVKQYNY